MDSRATGGSTPRNNDRVATGPSTFPGQLSAADSEQRLPPTGFAGVLQAGILSPPVQRMRTLVAAEAGAFPHVAADYASRSCDRNISQLAQALRTLHDRGLLDVDDASVAAEQFVWLVIGAPLNRLSLQGLARRDEDPHLQRTATEAVATFLSRYRQPTDAVPLLSLP
jgi:TetR/AcrR family transcriptional regulator, mexJK operon transcriptional repressor